MVYLHTFPINIIQMRILSHTRILWETHCRCSNWYRLSMNIQTNIPPLISLILLLVSTSNLLFFFEIHCTSMEDYMIIPSIL